MDKHWWQGRKQKAGDTWALLVMSAHGQWKIFAETTLTQKTRT
jgi:hypothetical protein